MTIPGFLDITLPLLRVAADGEEHLLRETVEQFSDRFDLTKEERNELLPSGREATFHNRVGWARTYMKKAGLLESTRRGHFRITQRGRDVLEQSPERIDIGFLDQYPEFVEFRKPKRQQDDPPIVDPDIERTPDEEIEQAYQGFRQGLAQDLLDTVKEASAAFFERLVIDLLVKMGYGGTRRDAGLAVGGSGDGGIDGIIKEDRLGLDVVYIQAKRWEGTVGRPEIHKFAGALMGQNARKGIFITTSGFTAAAREYVSRIDSKIVLIDGEELAQLMIDHNVGVAPFAVYELKRVDLDYFAEGG